MLVQLHGIADKYNAIPLQTWASKVLKENLTVLGRNIYDKTCSRLVKKYYSRCLKPGTSIGTVLAENLVKNSFDLIGTNRGKNLIHEFPIFGSDVLLVVRPNLWKLNRD